MIASCFTAVLVVQKTASRHQLEAADLVIRPNGCGHIRWDQIRRADELIDAGYQAGLESIPRIRALIER